ncbi:MAG: lysine 2,3-aminomutase [Desulfovibrionales bacterium]|nr:lysine 2,3-aminomutase [Desulfovibrionales bacterium]
MERLKHRKEKITPFLKSKFEFLKTKYGEQHPYYKGLSLQYFVSDQNTDEKFVLTNLKHYEAGVHIAEEHGFIPGLERLYRRTLVIEPTLVCSAHCQFCLRQNYTQHTLSDELLVDVAKYCGDSKNRDILNEVLITGGDPLLIPAKLEFLINALIRYAPNIRIIRIGSRIMTQCPEKFDASVFSIFSGKSDVRFELGTQLNHPVEFFPEAGEIFDRVNELGIKIYAQNVLLRGVNDDLETLVALYELMRRYNIESHYLFHCCPIVGMQHLRPSIEKSLALVRGLSMGGKISGRAKPMFAAMTDIGKILFYEGTIIKKKGGLLLLRSGYKLSERTDWNPSYEAPASAQVDENGFLTVWYADGVE